MKDNVSVELSIWQRRLMLAQQLLKQEISSVYRYLKREHTFSFRFHKLQYSGQDNIKMQLCGLCSGEDKLKIKFPKHCEICFRVGLVKCPGPQFYIQLVYKLDLRT